MYYSVAPADLHPTQIAPGAHIELRDAVWRVVRVDQTSTGKAAWRCVGGSEIVKDREALFLEVLEPRVTVLDPRETDLVRDTSSQHRAGYCTSSRCCGTGRRPGRSWW